MRTQSPVEVAYEKIEECDECDPEGKGLCRGHQLVMEDARRLEDERMDPQQHRVGIAGDPTPDAEYGAW